MTLQLTDIRVCWPEVNILLTQLYIDDNKRGASDWIPEDVYAACLYGYAKLYSSPDGFMIYKMEGSEFIVWFALSTNPKGEDLRSLYFGESCDLAEQSGAKTMAFYTTRKGYDRAINSGDFPGFKFQHSKYVREV